MLKFEIRNSIVDEEIVGEDDLELVSNVGVDTVKMREIEIQEKIKLKQTSSPTISSSTILLRISNFNMVVLTSKFNYLYRSDNSDLLVLQAPLFTNIPERTI
jgi:hypothetical protein